MSFPEFIKSDIKLTIGMLVSNHIQYIEKGMEAIKPLLEAVPSELIIVDTVGPENSDGSLDVVKRYTDKIYHFDWINDFSAARNVAMEHARGEWFMYFDDDEYFDDVTEFIEFFNSDECYKYNYGIYYTGDYTTPDHYQKDAAGRMIRRTANTRFEGVIHENFNESYMPVKQFNAFTHHFGYLFMTEEQKRAKSERNLTLLKKELELLGPNAKTCAQMVQEYMILDREEAGKKCVEFVEKLKGTKELEKTAGQWLIVSHIRFMAGWGSLEGILAMEEKSLKESKLNETARLVIAQQVAAVAYYIGNYSIAADRVKVYFELLDWLNEHQEQKVLQTNLDFPRFMMEEELFTMCKIGAVSENHLHNYDRAYRYIKRMDFKFCKNFEEIRGIIELTLKEMSDPAPQIEYYKRFYKEEFFTEPTLIKYLPEAIRKRLQED